MRAIFRVLWAVCGNEKDNDEGGWRGGETGIGYGGKGRGEMLGG